MSNETNDVKDTKNTDNNREESLGGFAQAVEFCKRNVRFIAVAGLFIVLVLILVNFMGGGKTVSDTVTTTETEEVMTEPAPAPVQESYEKDVYPEINQLITSYYIAYANGDNDTLATFADPISDTEKSYITVFSQYVEEYQNISCYTKKGMSEGTFIVSVYLEMKFKDIDITVPGLETFYIGKKDDGSYYIDNRCGLFNSRMKEFELEEDLAAFIEDFNHQDDVVALETEVWQKYEDILASNEELSTLVEKTIPDAMTVWASEQVAAAQKAEEEKAAAEEAAKKAAEEEAAKKAEEEKKAAELASAIPAYTTDKVNVRKEPSETADVLGQLEAGSQTTCFEVKDGWCRIDYNGGQQGYVRADFMSTEAPAAQTAAAETPAETPTASSSSGFAEGTVITIKESVNIRKSMGEDAEKIATAFAGEKVTVIMSYAEGWTKVTYGEKTGFIKTELLQ